MMRVEQARWSRREKKCTRGMDQIPIDDLLMMLVFQGRQIPG